MLLGIIAIVLVIEMKSLLIGESASRKQREAIQAAIEIEPGVMQLIHMRTEHLGPDELLVCAKVEFDHRFTLPEVAEAVDRVERNVRENVPEARVMYLEPDVDRAHRSSPGGHAARAHPRGAARDPGAHGGRRPRGRAPAPAPADRH